MQTILIVDDHPLFRAAIRDIIDRMVMTQGTAGGTEVCFHEASAFKEAFQIAAGNPDIGLVTLDICMPDSHDLSGLLRFRAVLPAMPVVVISTLDDPATISRTIVCGAAGFIPKSFSSRQMTEALRTVLAGGIYVPPQGTSRAEPAHSAQETGVTLTPRQAAVLDKLVEGKSNKQIARELAISDMTVKVHVTAVLRALGVESRAQAIVAVRGERAAAERRPTEVQPIIASD